jgi:hypothetical protein
VVRRDASRVEGARRTAYVVYPLLAGDHVEHDDGSVSPVQFTYAEFPDDKTLPYTVVECEHSAHDHVPRVMAVHVIHRDPALEVRGKDLQLVRLGDVVEEA